MAKIWSKMSACTLSKSAHACFCVNAQISIVAGDYYADSFGADYDAVLFSGVLIQEAVENQRLLLRKAYESMNSGGLIMVQDILKVGSYTETVPKIALESLVAAVFFGGAGGVVSGDETAELLTSAGFVAPKQTPLPGIYSLVTAVKP